MTDQPTTSAPAEVFTVSMLDGFQEAAEAIALRLRACLLGVLTRDARWLEFRGFTRWFAPWRIGGARPFFTPKWVPSFEKAHSAAHRSVWDRASAPVDEPLGWNYEAELMRGKGAVYFLHGSGTLLNQQFQGWSSEARGGKMEFHAKTGVYRFTPDANAYGYLRRLVPVAPKKLILPTPAPAPQLILPGGAA